MNNTNDTSTDADPKVLNVPNMNTNFEDKTVSYTIDYIIILQALSFFNIESSKVTSC